MQCIRPIRASFARDGSITYKERKAIPGLQSFEFPCRKCLPCRLNMAREKAIRAYHEAQMHEENIFLTLTYSDDHLKSPFLIQDDIVEFNKNLRNHLGNSPDHKIKIMYTGEYGEKTKRPHWHLLIFNYSPPDKIKHRTTDNGDDIYKSELIDELWGKNDASLCPNEIGALTIDSASYVARYAAKKLVHGNDQDHPYHPIHQTPKSGLGKTWIEKYYKQTFDLGYVYLPNGEKAAIPRFYVDWLKKKHPETYKHYVTNVREECIRLAEKNQLNDEMIFLKNLAEKIQGTPEYPLKQSRVKETILNQKFKKLQEHLKL